MKLPGDAVVFHHKFPFNEEECHLMLIGLHGLAEHDASAPGLAAKLARYIEDMNVEWAQRIELMTAMGAHEVTPIPKGDKP